MADTKVSTGDVLKLLAEFVKEFNQANVKSASVMNDFMQNGVKFACGDGGKLKGAAGETRASANAQADGQKWSAWVGIGLGIAALGAAAGSGGIAGQELKEMQGMRNAGIKEAFEKEAAGGGVTGELDAVAADGSIGTEEFGQELDDLTCEDIRNMQFENGRETDVVLRVNDGAQPAVNNTTNIDPEDQEEAIIQGTGKQEDLYPSQADKQQELDVIRQKYNSGYRRIVHAAPNTLNGASSVVPGIVQAPYGIKKGAHDAAGQTDQALGGLQNQATSYTADFNKGAVGEVQSTAALSDKAMQTVIRSAERA